MSSSPGLPSPSKFFPPKARQLHNGSVNASILEDASKLYQLQSNTWSKATESLREDKVVEGGVENKKGDPANPKGRETKVARESDADRPKQQRAWTKTFSVTKHLADIVSAAIVVESSPAGKVKKTSSSKLKEPAQTKIKKGKVTKAVDTNEALKDDGNVKRKKARKSLSLEEGSGSSVGASEGQKGQDLGEDLHNISLSDVGKLPSVDTFLPLGLDEATRRRKEWTPVRDTSEGLVILDSVDARPSDAPDAVVQNPASSHFGNLLGGYGFAQANSESTSRPEILRSSSGEALTKRRKLELVTTSFSSSTDTVKPKRNRSPKKKPQTVTAKATAPFIPIDDLPTTSLLDYLEPSGGTNAEGKNLSKESAKKQKRTRKKASAEPSPAKRKPSKSLSRTLLIPPEVALERAKNQDLLFGTSSQLARDESPTFLKETLQAIKESELAVEAHAEVSQGGLAASVASGSTDGSSLSLFSTSRNLWSVAARDSKGLLQEAEVVDLSVTPKVLLSRKDSAPTAASVKAAQQVPMKTSTATDLLKPDQEWLSIEDEPDPAPTHNEGALDVPSTSKEVALDTEQAIPRSLAEACLRERPKSRSPVKRVVAAKEPRQPKKPKQPKARKMPEEPPAKDTPEGMPNYKGFTTAQLSKEIASYGFKPIKKRENQIALLERCWDSKNRPALQTLPTNANLPQPTVAADLSVQPAKLDDTVIQRCKPPKARPSAASKEDAEALEGQRIPPKRRGQPPKVKASSIAGGDDDPVHPDKPLPQRKSQPKKATTATELTSKMATASPPAKRKPTSPPPADRTLELDTTHTPSSPSQPLTIPLSASPNPDIIPSFDTTLPPLSGTALLDKITEAITTHPPTHNMKNLTWHEKILLYDPIVLEDLASWLNLEGLGRVGVDEEVSSSMVKEWCEERSVCCLWRENLRGGERKRW